MFANSICDECEREFNLNELENFKCSDCRKITQDINILTCDICFNERPNDMIVKCCDKNNIRVCECNISICRRCADKMNKNCPTCRHKFHAFIYADEAKVKSNEAKVRIENNLTRFRIGEDVVISKCKINETTSIIRKGKIIKINSASVTISLYKYRTNVARIGNDYHYTIYIWYNNCFEGNICIKNLDRLKKREDITDDPHCRIFEYVTVYKMN